MADTEIIKVTKPAQTAEAAQAAAEVLRRGGLVGFPTETVYGIAAVATCADAMARLRKIKSRPKRPFTVHLGSPDDVGRYVRKAPGAARRLIARAWPGPVTLLLPTGGELAEKKLNTPSIRGTLCSGDLIGLRCPDEPTAQAMLSAVDEPVVAASANVAPELSVGIYESYMKGDMAEAMDFQQRLAPLRLAFGLGTHPAMLKAGAELAGLPGGPPRRPVRRLSDPDRQKLRQVIAEISR